MYQKGVKTKWQRQCDFIYIPSTRWNDGKNKWEFLIKKLQKVRHKISRFFSFQSVSPEILVRNPFTGDTATPSPSRLVGGLRPQLENFSGSGTFQWSNRRKPLFSGHKWVSFFYQLSPISNLSGPLSQGYYKLVQLLDLSFFFDFSTFPWNIWPAYRYQKTLKQLVANIVINF